MLAIAEFINKQEKEIEKLKEKEKIEKLKKEREIIKIKEMYLNSVFQVFQAIDPTIIDDHLNRNDYEKGRHELIKSLFPDVIESITDKELLASAQMNLAYHIPDYNDREGWDNVCGYMKEEKNQKPKEV